ncbi:MAG: CRISPR-associated endonuclease Cas1, partial [bacterium]
MPTIYIVSDYGKMYKKGQTINLKGKDDTISIIFPYKTDQLIILGNVEITSGALGLLMKHNIDTIFLSKNGRFNGKLVFQGGKNVFLRQKQFQLLNNKEFKLKFASAVVSGKLKNQLTFMQRIKRRRENDNKIKSAIETIKSNIKKI